MSSSPVGSTDAVGDAIAVVNDRYADAVGFLGTVLGGLDDVPGAEVVAMDRSGIDIATPAGRAARLDFVDEVPAEADALLGAVTRLVYTARAEAPDLPETSVERQLRELQEIRTSLATVTAVADVHRHLRRITVSGEDLREIAMPAPDTFLYLLLPPPGHTELTIDRSFTWQAHADMPAEAQPVGAYYTVAAHRPDPGEVDLLMVLHGDEGAGSAWATRATPGDPVALWGPRTSFHPPAGADRWILCADDTALPAAGRIIEARPAGMPVLVLAETTDDTTHQPLPEGADVEVRWLHRGDRSPGSTTLLVDALRSCRLTPDTFVWGAGEHRAVRGIRDVVTAADVHRTHRSLLAYWRR